MVNQVDSATKENINNRLRGMLSEFTAEYQSKRQFAPSIGIDRSNLYSVLRGEWNLSGAQVALFFYRLWEKGLLDEAVQSLFGEGDQCILLDSSSPALQREHLLLELVKRSKRRHSR